MLGLQKRGLSDIVTTVLIILLVIASIGVVWGFLKPTLSSASSEITTACATLDLQPLSCNVDTTNAQVRYGRNAGTATVTNVSLIFETSGGTKVFEATSVPNTLETKAQTITLAQIGGTPTKFSVAGTVRGESGNSKLCPGSYKISCGADTIVGGTSAPTCDSFTYSAWTPEPCTTGQQQTRSVLTSSPSGCTGGSPVTTQTCSPQSYTQGLNVRVFTGNWGNTHPQNHQELVALFGSPYTLAYTNTVTGPTHINWGNSPWPGISDNYATEYTGYIYISTPGIYSFAANGDDAIEIEIDGVVRGYWYGGHATCNPPSGFSSSQCFNFGQRTTEELNNGQGISLTAGYHQFAFRHEEGFGEDTAYALWKRPGDSAYTIIPPAAYFR